MLAIIDNETGKFVMKFDEENQVVVFTDDEDLALKCEEQRPLMHFIKKYSGSFGLDRRYAEVVCI